MEPSSPELPVVTSPMMTGPEVRLVPAVAAAADGGEVDGLPDYMQPVPDFGQEVEEELVHKWTVVKWSTLGTDRHYSPEFNCAGSRWRIMLFPQGNRNPGYVAAFIESLDAAELASRDPKWHACVSFNMRVANPSLEALCGRTSTSQHRFTLTETDWGFSMLIKMSQLTIPHEKFDNRCILEDDCFSIILTMKVLKDPLGILWHNFVDWDSRKETGYVGLRNQGATCYLNSLLQSLYFTNYFRKVSTMAAHLDQAQATYEIPTDNDEPQKSVPLALQRLFYNMQFSSGAVGTTELTKSFGWDTNDAFFQHDVQELNRVLQDNLESKMKGTPAEGAIRKLFTGKMKSFVRCINVDYESSRIEDFYDIQLNVKGCKTLRDSFVEYCAVETLEGENKYFAEGHGLQDSRKGVIFRQFPPVLHLQLKRFEYDMERDMLVKMNDRHEFPLEIELDEFLEEPDMTTDQKYHLHGVLVHSGDLHAGHYCAFIRPEKHGRWFKFDDDRVIPVTDREVLEDNYGGEIGKPNDAPMAAQRMQGARLHKRFTNAYMLVYVRDADLDEVLAPVTDEHIPGHLRRRFEEERLIAERRRKERDEAHLFFNLRVLSDDVIRRHEGHDLASYDDKTPSDFHVLRVRKDDTLRQFVGMIAEELRVGTENIRLWNMVTRQNKSVRPDLPFQEADFDLPLEQLRVKLNKPPAEALRIYAEVCEKPIEAVHDKPVFFWPRTQHSNLLLLFVKYYDPLVPKLEFVSTITILDNHVQFMDIVPQLLELKGLPPKTPVKLFEEVKIGMIEPIKLTDTFKQAELIDGDIICFQRDIVGEGILQISDPQLLSAPGYYEHLSNRITVMLKPKSKELPNKGDFELVLSKKMLQDAVLDKIAATLDIDPLKIRLWNATLGVTPIPRGMIRRTKTATLNEMLGNTFYSQASNVIFYEMLDVSILEFETKRYIKVQFVDATLKEQGPFDLLVLKTAHIVDVLGAAAVKVGFKGDLAHLRMLETSHSRISRVFQRDDLVSAMVDLQGSTLIVEEMCAEEIDKAPEDKVVPVTHFFKDPFRGHSTPFMFVLKPGEMFSETKKRLQARAEMTDKDFAKVKFSFLSQQYRLTPIEDDDILHDRPFVSPDAIGMDHPDKTGRLSRFGAEKAIKILN
ncbi:ubiquitin-specific protease ubp15 [Polyrhizophydium stewartii]|uniref:ubiquitinyl hydrolase 1 n=1 Tax=Polyrhizophydium stewartii TaxID=2732419 RepID=A0ABR4MXL0_9FUNG